MKIDNTYLRGQTALLRYEEEKLPKQPKADESIKTSEKDVILSITRENNLSASTSISSFNDAITAMSQVTSAVTANPASVSTAHFITADSVATLI